MTSDCDHVTDEQSGIISNHTRGEREALYENGDVIKFVEEELRHEVNHLVPKWIFSPHLGWYKIPEEFINQMSSCNCM
jgi:hypothetical protein